MTAVAAPSMVHPTGRAPAMRASAGPAGAVPFLLHLLRGSTAREVESAPPALWRAVEHAAARHGMGPLLHQRLQAAGGGNAPPDTRVRLRDVHLHSKLRAEAARARLATVLQALRAAGVPVIVLKGAMLAEAVYAAPELRPMGDIDLLVPPDRLEAARAALLELGYGSPYAAVISGHHHLPRFRRTGSLPIEIHWTPFPIEFTSDTRLEEMWSTARPVTVAGVEVLALSPEHLLHHLCLHAAYSHRLWIPLLHLHDLVAVAGRYPELDRKRVASLTREAGTARFVHASLMLARRAFPSRIPDLLPGDVPTATDRAVVELVWSSFVEESDPLPRLLTRLAAAPGLGERLRLIRAYLLPPRQRLELHRDFDDRHPYRSYLMRLRRHGRRGGGRLVDLFRTRGPLRRAWRSARSRVLVERWARGETQS
jgi:hypothetical protein